ncbi:hypothetical protein [Flammeovirga kamogawensis]|uniref:Uncharacterized protein n=1 Tax=Flammeovirga kamogawensis TaxID=373891 RepID=A0ABX8H0Z3_9BACT|nr:hypothetical protein [Flammeovirga kamogawensis]MBB6459422.1 Sec7-like guanine-nucleotide exchange factor [Flammeovirga kamogawensis]QWG08977.1 hypothetical protein KM029_08540 [Flammeovirga kamogawensis]TRX67267.1 hypothetical protein EO216_03585 [Flammeovirga kamogawensis]
MQTIYGPLVMMDYKLRQDFYANVLCVNKNRTDLPQVCGGRCQLKSKLANAATSESSSNNENTLKEVVAEPLSLSIFMFSKESLQGAINQLPVLIDDEVDDNYIFTIFHPPIV